MQHNFEYANATYEDLLEWACARIEREHMEWQAVQETLREMALVKSYELLGLYNIY